MEKNEKRKEQIEQIKEKQIKEKKESLIGVEHKSIPFSLFDPNPRPQIIRELWVLHDSDKLIMVIKIREKKQQS